MNILKITHWCPICRVSQEDWRVPATDGKKIIRRGENWQLDVIELYDKCNSCNADIHGRVVLKEGIVVGVEELGFRR